MLIIGERINSNRKSIADAILAKDIASIQEEALLQGKAGATILDVYCGTLDDDEEPEAMAWLIQTIQSVTTIPLCIDSININTLEAGLKVYKGQKPIINSINAEKEDYSEVLPLVKKYKTAVIASCVDDDGIPQNFDDASIVGTKLIEDLLNAGLQLEDIYFDPIIKSLTKDTNAATHVFELISFIRNKYPDIHITCGLSNISQGLPERQLLNRAFLILAIEHGLDAPILDPLDFNTTNLIYATNAILNRDNFCTEYTRAYRQGKFTEI